MNKNHGKDGRFSGGGAGKRLAGPGGLYKNLIASNGSSPLRAKARSEKGGSTSSLKKGATVRIISRNKDGSVHHQSDSFKVKGVKKDTIGYGTNPDTGKHWSAGRVVNDRYFTKSTHGAASIRVESTKIHKSRAAETKAALKASRADKGTHGTAINGKGQRVKIWVP